MMLTYRTAALLSTNSFAIAHHQFPPLADIVRVIKSKHKMYLIKDNKPYREYDIAMIDQKIPEGLCRIDDRCFTCNHLSLHVDVANVSNQPSTLATNTSTCDGIFIHGLADEGENITRLKGNHAETCIVIGDEDIREIWKLVEKGTPLEILP